MNPADLQIAHLLPRFRAALEAGYPRHRDLDYTELFRVCVPRASQLWREEIAAEIGAERVAAFEKALWKVRMLPEVSIARPMAFGYAYGAACHALAGGNEAQRNEAATTSALAMFLVGLFDHLLDRYPREFGAVGSLISDVSLKRYALERDLSALVYDPQQPVAAGLVSLYRLYFARCHRLMGEQQKDSPVARRWFQTLARMHQAESASVGFKMSSVIPNAALIEQTEMPGTYAFHAIAQSVCLGLDETSARKMEPFASNYTRLTRLVDGVADLKDDLRKGSWSGLTVRLALEAGDQAAAERIVMDTADECADLLTASLHRLPEMHWQAGDSFTLADILWAYVWTWAGGEVAGLDGQVVIPAGAA